MKKYRAYKVDITEMSYTRCMVPFDACILIYENVNSAPDSSDDSDDSSLRLKIIGQRFDLL